MEGTSKPKPKSKENVLEEHEIEAIKKACKTDEEKLVVLTLLYTGLRISEFIHIRKSWITFNPPAIRVPFEMQCSCFVCLKNKRGKGKWLAKTRSAERGVPILPEILPMIKEFFLKHECIMDYVPHRVRAWVVVKRVAKRSKISKILFPHALRATFASLLAKKGFDPFRIQNIMGWQSIEPASHYVRLFSQDIYKEIKEKW